MKTFGEMGIDAFPLCWPVGWVRSRSKKRSKFKTAFSVARDELVRELRLMGCPDWNLIISSNIPLKRDGLPYAGQANPTDSGVAVYFRLKQKPMVFACDTYINVTDNLYAITKTVEALRGIQRWGASDMMERSFSGFAALPAARSEIKKEWWDILDLRRDASKEEIKQRWLKLAQIYHPDKPGGSNEKMSELNQAYAKGIAE